MIHTLIWSSCLYVCFKLGSCYLFLLVALFAFKDDQMNTASYMHIWKYYLHTLYYTYEPPCWTDELNYINYRKNCKGKNMFMSSSSDCPVGKQILMIFAHNYVHIYINIINQWYFYVRIDCTIQMTAIFEHSDRISLECRRSFVKYRENIIVYAFKPSKFLFNLKLFMF